MPFHKLATFNKTQAINMHKRQHIWTKIIIAQLNIKKLQTLVSFMHLIFQSITIHESWRKIFSISSKTGLDQGRI